MAQPSTIDQLPDEAYKALMGWLNSRGVTQLEATRRINQFLEENGYPQRVTKSAVNRKYQEVKEAAEKVRQLREVTASLADQFGAREQGEQGRVLNQMLQSIIFDVGLLLRRGKVDEDKLPKVTKQLNELALATLRLESAASTNLKREDEIRRQTAEELKNKLGEQERAGKRLTADDMRAIIKEAYGV